MTLTKKNNVLFDPIPPDVLSKPDLNKKDKKLKTSEVLKNFQGYRLEEYRGVKGRELHNTQREKIEEQKVWKNFTSQQRSSSCAA